MRRKVKAGLLEADHDQCAIVVHYEVEATVLGELGEPIVAERQENTKVIKLNTLSENTNIPRLAEQILDKCKLIHVSGHAVWARGRRTLRRPTAPDAVSHTQCRPPHLLPSVALPPPRRCAIAPHHPPHRTSTARP